MAGTTIRGAAETVHGLHAGMAVAVAGAALICVISAAALVSERRSRHIHREATPDSSAREPLEVTA